MDFGREPLELIPRISAMDELVNAFSAENPSQHIAMITGVRGSGKTVFMTTACKRIAEQGNWFTVELSPEQDLLDSLVKKVANEKTLSKIFQRTQINLSFFGVGLKVDGSSPISDPEIALERMLDTMKKHRKRLLIAIDEVVNNQTMRVFASVFQILLRKELPVFLLMTGLFENIRAQSDGDTQVLVLICFWLSIPQVLCVLDKLRPQPLGRDRGIVALMSQGGLSRFRHVLIRPVITGYRRIEGFKDHKDVSATQYRLLDRSDLLRSGKLVKLLEPCGAHHRGTARHEPLPPA